MGQAGEGPEAVGWGMEGGGTEEVGRGERNQASKLERPLSATSAIPFQSLH